MATVVPLSDAKASDADQALDDKEKLPVTPSVGAVVATAAAPAPALPTELEWSQLDPADLNLKLLHASLARLHGLADPQVEAAKPDTPWLQQLLRTMREPDSKLTLRDFLAAVFDHYAERPFLATRADERSPYKAISYRDVWTRVKCIAAGMQATGVLQQAAEEQEEDASSGLAPPDPRMVTIGVYGFPSSDWACVYLACLWLGVCAVPLQTNMSREALTHVLRHSHVRLVAAHSDMLAQLVPAVAQAPSVRTIVTMDMGASLANSAHEVAAIAHLRKLTLNELAQLGQDAEKSNATTAASAEAESVPSTPSPVSVIIFTSGTTGKPKGAVFPEPLWRLMAALRHRPDVTSVITTLFNMSHISGLLGLHAALNAGGTLHFLLRHDMSSFFEDCRLVRPTTCFLVPRLVELVHDHYLSECQRLAAEQGKAHADDAIQQRVMEAMRHTFLGDRLALVVTGSAVTQPNTLAWFRRCFRVPLFNHLGTTEALNISDDSRVDRNNILEYKLLPVPELGYLVTDRPYPRGELCIKARDMVPEYYRDPDATAALRDSEGFLHTGDIVAEVAPDRIVYVDRARNTLKLSQGEFVALAQLEATFQAGGACVRQMFLYGRGDRAYLLAAVVPNMAQVRASLGDKADSPESVKALLQSELQRIASAASLAGWEVPRDMIVEPEAWSKANGMLTDSDKYARPALLARYKPAFDEMYQQIERRIHRAQEHRACAGKDERSASERLLAAVTGVLGCEVQQESGMQLSFVRMGGDSLSASRLSRLLTESCGVSPPVAMLLDSTATLGALVAWLEKAMSDRQQQRESWRPSFEQVHGGAAKIVRASDLTLERFFSSDAIQQAVRLPIASGPKHVLLTGANGYLGRFLLLELLQRGLCVTAIMRATSDEEAAKRLRASYGDLVSMLDSLSAQQGSLRVLAGDLMRGSLGLSPDVFASLCSSVDTVLHNGALVNHYISYEQLWEPNVLGTVELMRFAMLGQRKPIVFLSSVAVAHGAAGAGPNGAVLESQRGAEMWPERALTNKYAEGYASSKWACEVLLEQLSQRCGVPTTIIRSSMVLPHPDLKGQVNKSDFVTRLFASLVRTQCRPHSFYEEAESGSSSSGSESRPRAHFDGVPVNVSSAGIVATLLPKSAREEGACTTLHAVNAHHSDGVSLDSFADWVTSAGYRLETLRPHSRWFAELSRRLSELPREVRDTTAFPILHQWSQPVAPGAETKLDNSAFSRVLAAHTPFAAGVPVLDERFIHTYLAHMRSIGLIPEPAQQQL